MTRGANVVVGLSRESSQAEGAEPFRRDELR